MDFIYSVELYSESLKLKQVQISDNYNKSNLRTLQILDSVWNPDAKLTEIQRLKTSLDHFVAIKFSVL